MTGVIRTQLTGLARTIADLKDRVRVAVAGELGRAVSGAVQQVVQAVVAGRADPPRPEPPPAYRRASPGRWDEEDEEDRWGRPRDPWAGDPDDEDDRVRGPAAPVRHESPPAGPPPDNNQAVSTAVAAAVLVTRWWVVRRGTLLAAAGLGLGVGLLGILGGPVARTAVAVLAAVGDMMAATDALGDGAARLDHL